MAENSEKTYWVRWLVGTLWIVVFGAITTIATNLIATDKDSRDRDECLDRRVDKVETFIASTNVELAYIKDAVKEQREVSKEQLKILQELQGTKCPKSI